MQAPDAPGTSSVRTSSKRTRVFKGQSYGGCITCRGRRVKCDETKPTCMRCKTARFTCEGYASNFRIVNSPSLVPAAHSVVSSTSARTPLYHQPLLEEVLYLAQHFTIKPVPAHSTAYEKEARATLSAASEPAIKHALASLNTLRRVHAERGSISAAEQMTDSLQHGIQEYTSALGALATRLTGNEAAARKAALLCCQMFISIETAFNNFTSATQHFARGVQIMHQYGRPCSRNPDVMDEIPSVDLFTIKLFLSCPDSLFTFAPESLDKTEIEWKTMDDLGKPDLCQSMLQARRQLSSISMAVINLLERSKGRMSVELMVVIQAEQSQLLDHLGRWRSLFTPLISIAGRSNPLNARLGALFTMLFYSILRFSLGMVFEQLALDPDLLKAELDEMTWIASRLTKLKPNYC
ncbi:hypothetical protein FSARC_11533 [Fusarium sarcochroum]|uniref:Zn(2)-C6 fungal-type domain-containing protein n=1 Tax=Fusarium sarcochroum TaxID=1208366 RepID=A0A8H4TEX5_9HYPO|nr:hypothetical protein FSARC_11533 [Fusarium sarcochroum]